MKKKLHGKRERERRRRRRARVGMSHRNEDRGQTNDDTGEGDANWDEIGTHSPWRKVILCLVMGSLKT